MKKISYLVVSLIILISISACAGYKPIFGSSNLEFEITDYSLSGNKKLGNQIYSQLYNLSKASKKSPEVKNIYISIHTSKNINATAKDSAGKILAYRISLSTKVLVKDSITENEILNENFSFSSTYQVQDQFFDTKNLENQSMENLIQKTYQELIIKLSENIL